MPSAAVALPNWPDSTRRRSAGSRAWAWPEAGTEPQNSSGGNTFRPRPAGFVVNPTGRGPTFAMRVPCTHPAVAQPDGRVRPPVADQANLALGLLALVHQVAHT